MLPVLGPGWAAGLIVTPALPAQAEVQPGPREPRAWTRSLGLTLKSDHCLLLPQ